MFSFSFYYWYVRPPPIAAVCIGEVVGAVCSIFVCGDKYYMRRVLERWGGCIGGCVRRRCFNLHGVRIFGCTCGVCVCKQMGVCLCMLCAYVLYVNALVCAVSGRGLWSWWSYVHVYGLWASITLYDGG